VLLASTVSGIYWLLNDVVSLNIEIEDITLVAAMIAPIPDTIVLGTQGHLAVSSFLVITPIATARFVERMEGNWTWESSIVPSVDPGRQFAAMTVGLILILPAVYVGGVFAFEAKQPIGDENMNSKSANWTVSHQPLGADKATETFTDLNTMGILRMNIAENHEREQLRFVTYNQERYAFLVNDSEKTPDSHYFVLNKQSISRPLQRGYPTFSYYKCLNKNQTTIRQNHNLILVYESKAYSIYIVRNYPE
jgi:hypothetical protein